MRLIDADELIKEIENSRNNNPHKDFRVKRNHDIEHVHFIKMVYDQPTAFDKEKVLQEIDDFHTNEIRIMKDYKKNTMYIIITMENQTD